MSKTPLSKAFLNYFSNELKITKDDIRKWTQQAVERTAERYVEKQIKSGTVQQIVESTVRSKKLGWWGNEENFDDYIKDRVVHELLNGVHMKVDIVNTKKQATPVKIRLVKKGHGRVKS
jgi:phage major head subunit gpT-like protein